MALGNLVRTKTFISLQLSFIWNGKPDHGLLTRYQLLHPIGGSVAILGQGDARILRLTHHIGRVCKK